MARRLPVTNIFIEVGMLKRYYFSMEGTGIPFVLKMVYIRVRVGRISGRSPLVWLRDFPVSFFILTKAIPH